MYHRKTMKIKGFQEPPNEKTNLKNTTYMLPYLATQIHTSLSNNIQEQFIQYILWFINKSSNEITKDKATLLKFNKQILEL